MRKVAFFKGKVIAEEPAKTPYDWDEMVDFSNRIAKNITYNNKTKTEFFTRFEEDVEKAV